MPGESCSIVLAFDPTRNVQEGALFALPDPNGRNDLRKHGEVFGYARGFVEHLPAGLLTNGDPCPAAGTGAEVVVRRGVAGPGRVDVIWLHTLSCSAWQGGRNGDMRCADAGVLEGGARREWKRTSGGAEFLAHAVRAPLQRLAHLPRRRDRADRPGVNGRISALHRRRQRLYAPHQRRIGLTILHRNSRTGRWPVLCFRRPA